MLAYYHEGRQSHSTKLGPGILTGNNAINSISINEASLERTKNKRDSKISGLASTRSFTFLSSSANSSASRIIFSICSSVKRPLSLVMVIFSLLPVPCKYRVPWTIDCWFPKKATSIYRCIYIVYYTKTKAIGGTHKWIDLETSPRLHSYQSPYTSQIPLGHPGSLSFGHFPCIISFRLPLSSAPTFKIPLESISKVTSIWGWPRGAGGIPPSSNLTLGWGYLRVQMNSSWEIHANYWQGWKWLQKFWWNFTESTFSGKVLQRCFQTYFIGMYIIIRTLFNYSKPNFGKASNLPNKWLSLVMGRSPWWLKLTNEESSRAVKDFLYMIGFLTVKSWMFIKYHVRWFYVMSFFGSYCWHTQYYAKHNEYQNYLGDRSSFKCNTVPIQQVQATFIDLNVHSWLVVLICGEGLRLLGGNHLRVGVSRVNTGKMLIFGWMWWQWWGYHEITTLQIFQ